MPRKTWLGFAIIALLAGCAASTESPVEAGPYLLFFQNDSAELTPEARSLAEKAAADAVAFQASAVAVLGFSSPEGSADANRRLAEARVKNVEQALVAAGVSQDRLRPLSLGETGASRPGQSERYVRILLIR